MRYQRCIASEPVWLHHQCHERSRGRHIQQRHRRLELARANIRPDITPGMQFVLASVHKCKRKTAIGASRDRRSNAVRAFSAVGQCDGCLSNRLIRLIDDDPIYRNQLDVFRDDEVTKAGARPDPFKAVTRFVSAE